MARILVCAVVALAGILPCAASLAELTDRHELEIQLNWGLIDTDSELGAWPDGGFGKLRHDSRVSDQGSRRIAIAYRGQISATLSSHFVLDAIDDATDHIGLTEAYLEWRPLPRGPMRHKLKVGAFYPELSVENSGFAWESPYSISFSAINTWIGEEIRPIGAEWRASRPIGPQGSPHEIDFASGMFFGNDTAGTLLFWRGWSVHDRQTRLNERLALPPLIFPGPPNANPIVINRSLDPIAEIDDRPGYYLSTKWRYARRAQLGLSFYDNRADPFDFRDGQWAWATRFWQLSAQLSLPGDIALLAQRMRGDTHWLAPPSQDGSITPDMNLEVDDYDSYFVMLSKSLAERQRISLRFDRFDIWRTGQFSSDEGTAITIAYGVALNSRFDVKVEWLEIDSRRDLWPLFYAQTSRHEESMLQLGFAVRLFDSTSSRP